MKFSIIAGILIVTLLSLGSTASQAAPWRGGYGRGWGAPRPAVRVVVGGGGCYGGGYYRPHYYAPHYCAPAPRYYAPRYYGGYRHCR